MPSIIETAVVIIGAGPAGITAAIQLKRCGIPFVLLEGERIGGLLWNANLIENYPGFPDGISGPELVGLLEKQIDRLKICVFQEMVLSLDGDQSVFTTVTLGAVYRSSYVLVASGTKPRPWNLPVPTNLSPRVVSDIVPLLETKACHIVIIGSGDAAFDHALNMAKKRNSVTILNRDREVKCLSLLQERAQLTRSISYQDQVTVRAIKPDRTSQGILLECDFDGRSDVIAADYVITAVGREPNMAFLTDHLLQNKEKFMSSKKLFFIGDVQNGFLRQMAVAAGDGLRAAMLIHADLHKEMD